MGRLWDGTMTSEIRLLSFRSGQFHPLAEQPIIDITTKSPYLGCCDVLMKLLGTCPLNQILTIVG